MAKGGFNMPGGMGNMMKQVQRMQRKMEETQKMLEETETVATSGGGAVEVKLNGKKEFISIKIAPEAIDPEDVEMLEDLILAAINEGLRKVSDLSKEEMDKITGGMNISGIF